MKLKDGIVRPDLSLATKVEYGPGPDGTGNFLKFHLPDCIMVGIKIPEEGIVWGKKKIKGHLSG